ncbi:MAG: hypothetical protein LBJ94_03400 [Puniceicoccales bacterium]|jgi:hypothetical protein|nr:hypothetical protein [Puniceicoccales bacterium]
MENQEADILQIDVGPSRYFIAGDGSARLMGWQIGLADSSWRDVLFSGIGSQWQLNARAMPVAGLGELAFADIEFVRYPAEGDCLAFGPKDSELCHPCIPKISYRLSDLSMRFEISLDNVGTFPLHWCPLIRMPIRIPWHSDLTLDQYSIRSKAKKKFLLNEDLSLIESAKCGDKIPVVLPEGNVLAISAMQDYKASLVTKNEEEALSLIFCGKYPRAYFALRRGEKRGCVEFLCMPDLPNCDADFKDWSHYRCIQPNEGESFAVELSVC